MENYPFLARLHIPILRSSEGHDYVPEQGLRVALQQLNLWDKFLFISREWTRPQNGYFPDSVEGGLEYLFRNV